MIWHSASTVRIFCTLVVTTLCAGCITGMSDLTTSAEDYVDLSDPTANKAQLRAARWDIGIAGFFCYMTAPAYAERVTVNAGTVNVSVVCDTDSIGPGQGSGQVDRASFSFDALAGHDYVITKRDCSRCVKLTDETTGKMVDKFELSTKQPLRLTPVNPDAALILATPANPANAIQMKAPEFRYGFHYGDCMPTRGGFAGRRDFFEVDAGPIKIDAICDPPFSRRSRISSFDFVGEAGHIYTMTVTEKKCICLVDITSEEFVIACNPFRKIE